MTTTETLIVGAGPAGLAVAAALQQSGLPFALVEQAAHPAASWRNHYQRLHLHTHRRHSALPGLAIARSAGPYPSRQAVVDYLDQYVAHFGLAVQTGVTVKQLRPEPDHWDVDTGDGSHRARRVVMATGYTRVPQWPNIAGMATAPRPILHSSQYHSPDSLPGQRILVIGIGNSGAEIAMDLSQAGRDVTVSVRGGVNVVPRQIAGIPIATVNKASSVLPRALAERLAQWTMQRRYGDLPGRGLPALPYSAQCQMTEHQSVPLIDIGTIELIRQGRIAVAPAIEAIDGSLVRFTDEREAEYDQIVAATGYRPRLDEFLAADALLDPEGTPRVSGQQVMPGLFLCGFRVSPRGMLYEIGREASAIADQIQADS